MSYCRWSSDGFRCDLYCYEDVSGGWTTHVAGNKVVGDIPEELPMPYLTKDGGDGVETPEWTAWSVRQRQIHDYLGKAERVPIGFPHDGETFNDTTLADFHARLLMLRRAGYRFPDSVLAEVNEEMNDGRRETDRRSPSQEGQEGG